MNIEHKNYRITTTGEVKELSDLLIQISKVCMGDHQELVDDAKRLNKIIGYQQYNITAYHRLYYRRDSVLYIPNVNSKVAQELHYNIFKPIFEEAYKRCRNDWKHKH